MTIHRAQASIDGKFAGRAGATATVCAFAAKLSDAEVPPLVAHEVKRALVNFFAVGLAGGRDGTIDRLCRALAPYSGAGQAQVIGRSERFDLPTAAFLNAASANVYDFDDTHIPTIIHPTAPVAPAALAIAQAQPVTGAAMLGAVAIGIELACRIGNALHPFHYKRGWHITSTCGVFGAAAAAGRLLGQDEAGMRRALANAAASASGLVQTLGTMAKSVGVGNAARNGLLAAVFAEQGIAGPDAVFEGPLGVLTVFGDGDRSDELLADLGTDWQVLRNTYKPYPCGVVLNPVIDACLSLRDDPRFSVDAVDQVVVRGQPLLRQRTDRPQPRNGRESQLSAHHAVAVTLLKGRPGLADFSDEAVTEAATRALAAKVRVVEDPTVSDGVAAVDVTLAEGPALSCQIDIASGSLEAPLTDDDLADKLRELSQGRLSADAAERLLERLWTLESLARADAVFG